MVGYRCDVYDGKLWNDFKVVEGKPFLSSQDSQGLGLMLNVDWFQPFKHTTYSVGAVYLVIMNQPRSVRFKREQVIRVQKLVGLPPPHSNYLGVFPRFRRTFPEVITFGEASAHEF